MRITKNLVPSKIFIIFIELTIHSNLSTDYLKAHFPNPLKVFCTYFVRFPTKFFFVTEISFVSRQK